MLNIPMIEVSKAQFLEPVVLWFRTPVNARTSFKSGVHFFRKQCAEASKGPGGVGVGYRSGEIGLLLFGLAINYYNCV